MSCPGITNFYSESPSCFTIRSNFNYILPVYNKCQPLDHISQNDKVQELMLILLLKELHRIFPNYIMLMLFINE